MRDLPIGFIDSGFGGLTVVKQSLKQLPNESIIYLGDNARAPYGPRSLKEVKRFIWQLTNFLREKGIKMLVIACNTGTAAALEEIRSSLAIPVVGVIHSGSRAAIKKTSNNRIGVIGTQGTVDSNLYQEIMQDKVNHLDIISLACPEFVHIVEKQEIDDPSSYQTIEERLRPLKESHIDTLVLGCTHYPLLYKQIEEVMGEEVILIDSGSETINEVSTILDYFNLSRSAKEAKECPPSQTYYTTGDPDSFAKFAREWLDNPSIQVKKCDIKGEIIIESTNS